MKETGKAFKVTALFALLLGFVLTFGKTDAYAEDLHNNHEGWTKIQSTDLANSDFVLTSGKYYLSENITTTHSLIIGNGTDEAEVTLCLNGHSLTSSGNQVISINPSSILVIDDCTPEKNGSLIIASTGHSVVAANKGGISEEWASASLYINAGTLKSSGGESEASIVNLYWGAFHRGFDFQFNMSGGSIIAPNQDGIYVAANSNINIENANIFAKNCAVEVHADEEVNIKKSNISVTGDYAIYCGETQDILIDECIIKAQGLSALYIEIFREFSMSSSQISAMDNAVDLTGNSNTQATITDCNITADYNAVFLYNTPLKIANSVIESKSGYVNGKGLKPGYPIYCERSKLWVEGNVTLAAKEDYPQIYLEDSKMGMPETLPNKPFSFFLKDEKVGDILMLEPDGQGNKSAEVFKERFPNRKISEFLVPAVGYYYIDELNGNYYIGCRNIDKQPTVESPVMKISEEGSVKYQWYDVTPTTYMLTDANTNIGQGTYDSSQNEWYLMTAKKGFSFSQEHDYGELVIKVKELHDVPLAGGYTPNGYNVLTVMSEDYDISLGTLNISEPGTYTVQIPFKGLMEIIPRLSKDVTAEISLNCYDINYPIDGRATNTLSSPHGGYTSCMAIYERKMLSRDGQSDVYKPKDISGVLLSKPVYQKECTVNFETNGGSKVSSAKAILGSLVTKPSNPSFKGLTFDGWYKDAKLKTPWNFKSDKVNADITLYAKWKVSNEQYEEYSAHVLNDFRVNYSKGCVKFTWGREKEADEYGIFLQKCGPAFKSKPTAIVKAGNKKNLSKSLKKIGTGKLPKTPIKGYVAAYKYVGNQKIELGRTLTGHSTLANYKKSTNPKSIKVNKTSVTIKKGKKFTIVATLTKQNNAKKLLSKDHCAPIRYVSSNSKIAKVDNKGVITGKKKGTAYVYAVTIDGMNKKIKVNVK